MLPTFSLVSCLVPHNVLSRCSRPLLLFRRNCPTRPCTRRVLLTQNTSHLHTQVSVSAPTWNSIYFLRASDGGLSYHFGVLGYTGSKAHIGYRFPLTYVFYRSRSWKFWANRVLGPANCPRPRYTISRLPSFYTLSPPVYLALPCYLGSAGQHTIAQARSSWPSALH